MTRQSASVAHMSTPRFIVSLLLAFALSGAPVLHGLAKAALPAPVAAASEHAKHNVGHDVATHHEHGKSGSPCAQNDSCTGAVLFQLHALVYECLAPADGRRPYPLGDDAGCATASFFLPRLRARHSGSPAERIDRRLRW